VLQGGSLAIVSIAALWFVEPAFDVALMQQWDVIAGDCLAGR
jgi:hypothetical protein